MQQITLNINNEKNERLHAILDLPPLKKPHAYALFAHCFTCSSSISAVKNISRELTNQGYGVVRFDFTGLGQSEGSFDESNFSANISDLESVSAYMAQHYAAPSLLIGHSLGGAASIIAGTRLQHIKAVAVIGAPSEATHVAHLFEPHIDEIEWKGEATVSIGGRPFLVSKQFLDDLGDNHVLKSMKTLKKPVLILHAPNDTIVPINHASALYHAASHPKSFVSLDSADHLLSRRDDSLYAARIIGTWAGNYLSKDTVEASHPETFGEQVVVQLNLTNNFTSVVSNGRHTCVADEPSSAGGEDLGFSPYELLNASLGACTVMTLKLYAERKKWPLQEVSVFLSHTRKHADDADTEKMGNLDVISKKIHLQGELTAAQREKLMEISGKCPVHRTLLSDIRIESTILDSEPEKL